jgi:hypothetical protein
MADFDRTHEYILGRQACIRGRRLTPHGSNVDSSLLDSSLIRIVIHRGLPRCRDLISSQDWAGLQGAGIPTLRAKRSLQTEDADMARLPVLLISGGDGGRYPEYLRHKCRPYTPTPVGATGRSRGCMLSSSGISSCAACPRQSTPPPSQCVCHGSPAASLRRSIRHIPVCSWD